MRFALLFTLIFLTSFSAKTQDNTGITGSWKIIILYDTSMYINLETDSSSLSGEMLNIYSDSAEQKNMINNAKNIFGKIQFHFEKDGSFKQTVDSLTILTGRYKIDIANRKLELSSKNSLDQDVAEKMDYELIDNILKFSILQDDMKLDLVLRKIVQ